MMIQNNEPFMRLAITEARVNLRTMDGGPFGAVVVRDGRVLSAARNSVLRTDATSHAEINAIRKASEALGSYDLSGCSIFSTTEPCPMCFSAIHWARINELYFGTEIADVANLGFNEMLLSNKMLGEIGNSPVKIFPGFLRDECLRLLSDWDALEEKVVY